jgi:aerobic carbon-monoxide dehydrogenase medium subunit
VPVLAERTMAALAGRSAEAASIAAAQAALAQELEPPADLNGGADMKRHLAQVLLARAIKRLIAGGEAPT